MGVSRPLRITQLVVTADFAGTERYIVEISLGLAQRGHDVCVIGGAADSMPGALGGSAVRWLPGETPARAMRCLRQSGRRDIVHSHMAKADVVAFGAAGLTGGRRISTRHITAARGYTPTARRLAPMIRRTLAAELAVSEFVSRSLEQPSDRVLLNGVRPVPVVRTPRRRTVLVAQRLEAEKDTSIAVEGFVRSGLADQGWRLIIAGSGSQLAALNAQVSTGGISGSTEFLGWVADPAQLYAREGVLVAPAPAEPCGLTVLEAMAAGMPVIASGSGGHLETVGQSSRAVLVPPGDSGALALALRELAGDDDARADYGRELQRLQRDHLTLERHLDSLEQIYAGTLRAPDPAGGLNQRRRRREPVDGG